MTGPRVVKTIVPLANDKIALYFSPRVAHAFREVTSDMTLYKGVRLTVLLQAVYDQGKKDGARDVAESFGRMMDTIPHRNPGQPARRRKKGH